ncbi:neural Wiskott-Aldrich syndrome protein [Teleopsis dalmanni]|uniref:neural Wiskott-Aldrich syndrome protein n=1 Tax=Teleopsis dalmanni TaxID=139649 RepID=UPI0018CF3313|nr:neural Wiskott-Aldrich syndrome protein [Teleopsis dalmanni]
MTVKSLNTAVVQIFKTEGSAHSHWKKKHTGIVCFIKDNAIRSYFLRAYCLMKEELIWEHKIYDGMKIIKARPFLLTFEGHDGHIGLNFVSEDECDSFYRAVDTMIENRNRKKLEKRSRPKSQNAPNAPPGVDISSRQPMSHTMTDSSVQLRNHPKLGTVTITPTPAMPPPKNFLTAGVGLSSTSSKDKKRKVTKADISTPTNFRHVTHVGWDADKGFDYQGGGNDEMLKTFFAKAGVSESELEDRATRQFIYDFVESNNVLASVQSERFEDPKPVAAVAPPPVPTRHHHNQNGNAPNQRTAPPPPPARQPPPPVPTTVPGSARQPAPPTRPPPINIPAPPPAPPTISAPAVAPPPPPPPPPAAMPPPPPPIPSLVPPTITTTHAPNETKSSASNVPVVNDTRNALMESIRKGTTLKKVDTSALSTGSGDSRSDLMSEIRMGIELRPAQNRELGVNRSSDDGAGTDALADALRRALQERGRVIQSSDDESASSGNDDEWDD